MTRFGRIIDHHPIITMLVSATILAFVFVGAWLTS